MSMRQNIIAFLFLLPLTCPASGLAQSQKPADAVYMPGGTLTASYSAADFAPDANLQKKIWKGANCVQFDHSIDGKATHPAEQTRVDAAWTEVYIYFALSCKYEDVNNLDG